MATALQERLDPVVSTAPPPTADEAIPPLSTLADDGPEPAALAEGVVEVVSSSATPTVPSGFPVLGLAAAVSVHLLVAAAFYAWLLHKPPEEFQALGDAFEITLAEDKAGHLDGKADQAPDGAPRPDEAHAPDAHAAVRPTEQQPPAPAPTPPQPAQPTQPPSFDAMPMPATPPPVPDTADAWAPRVHPAITPPAPPPAPAKPVARAPPAAPAATQPVAPRPSLQRSIDVRDIPGRAAHREMAAGSDSGGPSAVGYGMLVFRAISRVRFYPQRAGDRGDQGRVLLRVTIGESGRLLDAYIARSSGFPELDAATIEMAHRASYPPLPREMGAQRTIDVPVVFDIRDR